MLVLSLLMLLFLLLLELLLLKQGLLLHLHLELLVLLLLLLKCEHSGVQGGQGFVVVVAFSLTFRLGWQLPGWRLRRLRERR
jgi:hypothetical protein